MPCIFNAHLSDPLHSGALSHAPRFQGHVAGLCAFLLGQQALPSTFLAHLSFLRLPCELVLLRS